MSTHRAMLSWRHTPTGHWRLWIDESGRGDGGQAIGLPAAIHTALSGGDAPALTDDPTSDLLAWETSDRARVARLQAITERLRQVLQAAQAELHAETGPGTRVRWPHRRSLVTQVRDAADELAAQTEALHDAVTLLQAIRDLLRAVAGSSGWTSIAVARRPARTHTTGWIGCHRPGRWWLREAGRPGRGTGCGERGRDRELAVVGWWWR